MRRNKGFTAVELMVVIAIVAILATLALPSFSQMIKRWQVQQDVNALTDAIYLARTEAVKHGGGVTVAVAAGCGGWGCGWQVQKDAEVIKTVETNDNNNITASAAQLTLNRWGNPVDGAEQPEDFNVTVTHKRDAVMSKCVSFKQGGIVSTDDGAC